MELEVLIRLLLGHVLGDSVFQPEWMARNKRVAWMERLQHSFIVAGLAFMLANLNVYHLAILFTSHLVIDLKWPFITDIGQRLNIRSTIIDQFLHILVSIIVWITTW